MHTLRIPTPTTGRVLVADSAGSSERGVLVGCHGYGQNAAIMFEDMKRIPGVDTWRLVSVQALHRFYTRNDQGVVASWMTREDRDDAIADNIEYLNRVVAEVTSDVGRPFRAGELPIVFLGFSQGASMAARGAVRGKQRAAGLIMLGGDIPGDVRQEAFAHWPPVLLGCGERDEWYATKVDSDAAFLRERRVQHEVVRFVGGHEFTDQFRASVGRFLTALSG